MGMYTVGGSGGEGVVVMTAACPIPVGLRVPLHQSLSSSSREKSRAPVVVDGGSFGISRLAAALRHRFLVGDELGSSTEKFRGRRRRLGWWSRISLDKEAGHCIVCVDAKSGSLGWQVGDGHSFSFCVRMDWGREAGLSLWLIRGLAGSLGSHWPTPAQPSLVISV